MDGDADKEKKRRRSRSEEFTTPATANINSYGTEKMSVGTGPGPSTSRISVQTMDRSDLRSLLHEPGVCSALSIHGMFTVCTCRGSPRSDSHSIFP